MFRPTLNRICQMTSRKLWTITVDSRVWGKLARRLCLEQNISKKSKVCASLDHLSYFVNINQKHGCCSDRGSNWGKSLFTECMHLLAICSVQARGTKSSCSANIIAKELAYNGTWTLLMPNKRLVYANTFCVPKLCFPWKMLPIITTLVVNLAVGSWWHVDYGFS